MKHPLYMLLSLTLVMLIVSAATFLLLVHDQRWLKEQTQNYVTDLTGRNFLIDGSLELRLSLHPTMKVEGMRLANMDWAGEVEIIRLERLQVSVDLWSLLSGQVIFDFVELDGLTIALEENVQGEVNWDLLSSRANDVEYKMPIGDLSVRVDRLVLNEMHLLYKAPEQHKPLNLILAMLKADRMADGQTNLTAHGSLGELPLDIKAYVGTLKHSVSEGSKTMQAHLSLGKINLDVRGEVANSHAGEGTNLIINFSGPEFSWVTEKFALPEFSQGPFDFNLKLESIGDIEKLVISGDLGSLNIVAKGEIDSFSNPREGRLKFKLDGPDMQKLAAALGEPNLISSPYIFQGDLSAHLGAVKIHTFTFEVGKTTGQLIGKMGEWPGLTDTELHLMIRGPDLSAWGPALRVKGLSALPFTYSGKLVNKEASDALLSSNRLDVGDSYIELTGTLPELQSPDNISARFQITLPSIRNMPLYSDTKSMPDLPANISGQIEYLHDQVRLNKVSGSIGTSIFNIDALLVLEEELAGSHVKFNIAGSDFKPLLPSNKLASLPGKFRASGRVELEKGRDLLQNLELSLGSIQARINGSVDDLGSPTSAQLSASINLASLSELDGFMGQDFPDLPFNMKTSFVGSDSQYTLEPLQAMLGPSDLSGKIKLDLRADPSITGYLRSTFLDVAWLTKPNERKKRVTKSTEKFFPNIPIPPIDFGGLNMQLTLSAEHLKIDFTELNRVKLDLSLHENYLHIDSFKFGGSVGERVSGKLAIDAIDGLTQLGFTANGKHLRLNVAATENEDVTKLPQTDLAIDLHGKGVTYHELVSSLNGKIHIAQGKGLIANAGLELLFSDFLTKLFNTLNPYAQNAKYTELECSVINAKIKSGEILINPLVFHTNQVTILSEGNINLATETIDMIFETKVRKGVGISLGGVVYPFIKLGGNLLSPSIELDPVGVTVSGSVAVATYGLSLLATSLYDRFLSSKDPCGEALKQ